MQSRLCYISTGISWELGWEKGLQQLHSHTGSFPGGFRKIIMQRRPCICLLVSPWCQLLKWRGLNELSKSVRRAW
jgi:hypothetical protein